MKYVLLFVFVFLAGFGLLQLLNHEEEKPVSSTLLASSVLVDTIANTNDFADRTTIIEDDSIDYSMTGGYYDITWKDLSKVSFEERMNQEYQAMIAYPVFPPSIKQLDGEKIQIKGYVIPFEETGDTTILILSAFPFTSCFFCGGAGPETVMDVQMKKQGTRFKQDALVTFKGRLRLNDSDLDYLNYILDEAAIGNQE